MTQVQLRDLMAVNGLSLLDTENLIRRLLSDVVRSVDYESWPEAADNARFLADALQWHAKRMKDALR